MPVNIRILATSNRNMIDAINKGDFREDLYFRLNVVNLKLPALRDRVQDILPLANYFMAKFCETNGMPTKSFSDEALMAMKKYTWRGNVRELENMIHRAVLLSDRLIEPGDIFGYDHTFATTTDTFDETAKAADGPICVGDDQLSFVGRTVADMEKELILGTLKHCLGNRTHAATILGISIRTLRNKIREYNAGAEDDLDEGHHEKENFFVPKGTQVNPYVAGKTVV